jgi:co-chaperonin GroES (HSP10)
MSETIKAYGSAVFAKVDERETMVSPGSKLFLPPSMNGRPSRATVLSVGPDATDVDAGDRVIFDAYKVQLVLGGGQLANAQGTPIANPGDLFFVDVDDVLAVEEPDA